MSTYIWIDGTWTRGQDGKPRVILFGRDYENVQQTVYKAVKGFRPYFYAPSHEVEESGEIVIDALGRRVKKVFANLPSDVRRLREQYSWTDEADILFDVRFVVDAGIKYAFDDGVRPIDVDKPLQPRVCFFDIEVDSPPEIMPRPEKPEWPIVMIQCLDSYTGEIRIFTWNMPEKVDEQVVCASEKHMLYEFARYVQRKDFDVLSGWFCVPKGTYVETASGLRKIEQIGEGDRLIEQVSVRRKYETGIKPIARVYTKLGWWFDTSTQHKFKAYKIPEGVRYNRRNVHTYDWDWVPAEKLNDSHILECPFAIYVDNQPTPELTEKLCYLAGFAYGDGSIQDYTAAGVAFKIYQKDGNLLQQITGRDKVWQHPDGTYVARVNLQQASDLIVQNGRKQLNYEMLSRLSLRQFAAFVAGWFDADGCVQKGGNIECGQGYTIAITDKNWEPTVSILFKDFGVITRVSRDSYNVVWYIRLIAAIPEFWEAFCEWSRKVTKNMVRNKVARTVSPNRLEHFSWTVIDQRLYVRVDRVDQIGAKKTMDMETSSHWYSIGCITHNSNGYDLPYLKKRSDKIGVPLQLARYPAMSGIRLGKRSVRIVGRQCVDLLEAFKKWHKAKGELETYDLKFVSKKFGGFQYEDYGDSIRVLLEEKDYETMLEYGRNDVIALQRIDEKIGLFEFYEYLRFIVGCKLEDTLQNSKIIEMLLMRNGIKPMPTRQYGVTEVDRYTGALVLEPPLGIHEWVGVFDLASLYPTIIMAFDISPDVDKMIPKVITTILQERERLRKLRLEGKADETTKMKEVVLKFIANSFYGVLGWPGFRLYKRELAEFITTKGREINRYLQQCAAERGFRAIYGDTDSVFIRGVMSPEMGLELQEYFNERLQEWADEVGAKIAPTIKFEKLFRRIIFKKKIGSNEAAKKRYAGWLIWEDGREVDEIKIVGMETRRSDVAEITKELMEQIMVCLLKEGDTRAVGKMLRKVLREFDKLPLQKIAIPKGVKKDLDQYKTESAWIVGMRNAQKLLGLRFRQDRKPKLLYMRRPVDRLCITEDVEVLPEHFQVDWEMMKEKVIRQKFEAILESIGLSWDQVVEGQTTLEGWF